MSIHWYTTWDSFHVGAAGEEFSRADSDNGPQSPKYL
jgi:hypothetical protein